MDWKKFVGPAILAGAAILVLVAVNIIGNVRYGRGDTVDPGFVQTSCCMGFLSILMCLSSIVWFAFVLGMKRSNTVFLATDSGDLHHTADRLANEFAQQDRIFYSRQSGCVIFTRKICY